MEKAAAVFAGRSGLDNEAGRLNVLRIPEVSMRINEAQKLIDNDVACGFDLKLFLQSETDTFNRNVRMKSLLAAVVQVGLWDRFLKIHKKPKFVLGPTNGDSALRVAAGEISLAELVKSSSAILHLRNQNFSNLSVSNPLVLENVTASECRLFELKPNGRSYEKQEAIAYSVEALLELIAVEDLNKVVVIGLSDPKTELELAHASSEVPPVPTLNIANSIELDPLLTWFWNGEEALKKAQ